MRQAEKFDILIVGGGPAGLAVASTLGDEISALLVHQDKDIGVPVRTSGGCWVKDMERLGIPRHCGQPVSKADIYSDNEHLALDMRSNPVAILNVTETYKWLASQSKAEIRCHAKFLQTRQDANGYLSRIRIAGTEVEVRSDKIIDASGWQCAVLDSLGIHAPPERRGVGVEYEFAAPEHDPDRAVLFFGSAVPTGYGWAFPTTSQTLRLGVGVIKPASSRSPKDLMAALLETDALARMELPTPSNIHVNAGILPSVPYEQKLVFGDVIRVGDSANMATPTLGEGIRICIEQGRGLGLALSQGRSAVKAWERAAQRRFSLQYRIGYLANERAARYQPPDWDLSVQRMKRLPPHELLDFFRNDFSAQVIARRGAQAIGRKIRRALLG